MKVQRGGIRRPSVLLRTHPHLTIAEPQVSPAPKPAVAMVSPAFTLPLLTASSKANGIDAALVFP